MSPEEIVTELSLRLASIDASPTEIIYAISMRDLLSAIAKRMGEKSLSLDTKDLLLARDEVRDAIAHHLDEREFIDIGLESWEIVRNL